MADIALFHSVLGVRDGVRAAADTLRDAGHTITVVDQYDGRVFEDYAEASSYVDDVIGMPELTAAALRAVEDLPEDLVPMGFSNGGGMAQWVALHRPVSAAVLFSGIIAPRWLETLETGLRWPVGVPVQSHYMRGDPFRTGAGVEEFGAFVAASGVTLEHHWYEGDGHLFTDASKPDEYDQAATDLLWERVLGFLDRLGPDGLEALDDVV